VVRVKNKLSTPLTSNSPNKLPSLEQKATPIPPPPEASSLPPLGNTQAYSLRRPRQFSVSHAPDRSVDAHRMIWLAYRDTLRAASTEPRKQQSSPAGPEDCTETLIQKYKQKNRNRLRTKDLQEAANDSALSLACMRARLEYNMERYLIAKKQEIQHIKVVKCNHTGKRMIYK